MSRRFAVFTALVAMLASPAGAQASYRIEVNATHVHLAVNDHEVALVSYRRHGRLVHALASGAINARPPSRAVPQVRFRMDWTGGARFRGGITWKTFRNTCGTYDGPSLPWLVTACKASDGTYWALQAWQPYLPHRGYPPWQSRQTEWELHLSHWSGQLAKLEVWTDWAFKGQAHDLFGRLSYLGVPVYGFGTGKDGGPSDLYGRSLYIDTLNSAYGRGWKRETSIVFRNPTGAFCYSFWPTHDKTLPGYPNNRRPAGKGQRYRVTVMGPGATPDVMWEGAGLHDYDPKNPADVDYERRMDALFMQVTAGDKFCPTQR